MKIKSGFALAVISVLCLGVAHGGTLKNFFTGKNKQGSDATTEPAAGDHIEPGAQTEQATPETGNLNPSAPVAETPQSEPEPAAPAAPATPKPESRTKIVGDPVVMKIGRREFKRSEIMADLKLIPPQLLRSVPSDKVFGLLLDQKMSTYLMVEQAKKAGLDRTKEYLDRCEHMQKELLARMYLLKEVSPKTESEVELRKEYQRYVSEFKSGKEIHLFQIVCESEDEAKKVIEELNKGGDFGKLAKEHSIAPSKEQNGDESYIPVDLLPPDMKKSLTALKANEYTKTPVVLDRESRKTYHVFKVAETRNSKPLTFDESRPMLKQIVAQKSIMDMIARFEKQYNVVKFNEDGTPLGTPAPGDNNTAKTPAPGTAPATAPATATTTAVSPSAPAAPATPATQPVAEPQGIATAPAA